MKKRVPVRFIKAHPPYNAREIAGFDPDKAQRLIDAGIAIPTGVGAPPVDRQVKSPPASKVPAKPAPRKRGSRKG